MRCMLAFKDELVYDSIGLVKLLVRNQEDANILSRRSSTSKFDSDRLLNVGDHLPDHLTDHTFVVCREKGKRWIKAYTGRDMRECPSIQGIQISIRVHNLFVCITLRAPASRFSPRSAVLVMILPYNRVSRLFIEKHEYINVNSKIYIVYTSKRTRNKNETESGTRNQTFRGPTQDMICIIRFFCTIMLGSNR